MTQSPPQENGVGRRKYLDWMRGLAVLVMIEAHVLDSWTRFDARHSHAYAWSMIVAGFGAPLFLFLAGVSVALSAGSKSRRTGDAAAAATATIKRGAWIFFLALVFRVQSWILGLGSPRTLLKVDILNIMGPSIMLAAFIWGACRDRRARSTVLVLAAAVISCSHCSPPEPNQSFHPTTAALVRYGKLVGVAGEPIVLAAENSSTQRSE